MFRTAMRNLAARKLRLVTTGLAIMLGVAFMAGTLVLTDTVKKTFDTLFADAYAATDAVVRGESRFEDPSQFGEQRGRIDGSLLEVVEGVDGVAEAQGDVWGFAQIVDTNGDPVGNPGQGAPTVGTNWYESPISPWSVTDGRPPEADDEVMFDQTSADKAGYSAGDRATVLVAGAPLEVTVTGIASFVGGESTGGASFVLFTTPAAQRYVGEESQFDSISVAAGEGVSQDELVGRIEATMPDGVEVVTGETITQESQQAVREALSFFDTFMMVFTIIALLVGGFMIFNTFFITVAQRTRENALLRAIGASRRQVLAAVLLEALGVGFVASVLGVGAGVLVAAGLKAMLDAFGVGLPAGGLEFTPRAGLVAFTAGMLVTLVAAVSPARKAGKVPPVAALRDVAVGSTGYGSKERVIVGLSILACGAGALLYGLFGNPSSPLAIVGVGALLVFFGVATLGRTISLPMSRVLGMPLPRVRGIAGRLARENAMRNPKRTAATASSLMIGVGIVGFITIFAASAKASFSATVDRLVSADYIVTAGSFGAGGVAPEFAEQLSDRPEVAAAAATRLGVAEIDGTVASVSGVDPAAFEITDVGPVQGSPADLDEDSIAVFEDVAADRGLSIGDRVPAEFRLTGERDLTVAMIFREEAAFNVEGSPWLMSMDGFEAGFPDVPDAQVFVLKADGVSSSETLAAIKSVAEGYPGTQVLDQSEYKAEQMSFVDQLLGIVYVMLALAIVIALLGIGNTLALSILERRREIGVLRAVGMTRRQLRSTIRWESVIIALQGTVLGLAVSVFFGWAMVSALEDDGFGTFAIPLTSMVVVVVLAALAGVVAAVLPSRRAARLDVLRAVVTE
jgi:putative ABC transport system permease protein